jgi:Zn-finger nucleic acid-binding protein
VKCPVCSDVRMREVEKNGVHIDICPDCKGVWLDRGELDKLMPGVREVREEYNEWHREDDDRDRKYAEKNASYSKPYSDDYKHSKHKKKNSVLDVLSDLF